MAPKYTTVFDSVARADYALGGMCGAAAYRSTTTESTMKTPNGSGGILKFLHPQNRSVPLVRIPTGFDPLITDQVRIFAALGFDKAGLPHKVIPAVYMLLRAHEAGRLEGVHTIVEGTSGNTGLGLAIAAPAFGLKVELYVRSDTPLTKLALLRFYGARFQDFPEREGEATCIERAREKGKEPGYLNLDQYDNDDNPKAFEKFLAPKILDPFEATLSAVAAGVGTGGTVVGLARYIRACEFSTKVVGVVCAEGDEGPVPGVRAESKLSLELVRLPWRSAISEGALMTLGKRSRAYQASLDLRRALGVCPGPSSGLAYVGLLDFLRKEKDSGRLDALRGRDGSIKAAFVCPDLGESYADKYSTILDVVD